MSRSYSTDSPQGNVAFGAPVIRRAVAADAPALAAIGAQTFAETFGQMYPPEDLNEFLQTAYGLERTRADLEDPRQAAWLVEAEGRVVGLAQAGPCHLPHPEVKGSCGELYRLYMLKALQSGGTGSRLLAENLSWLEPNGPPRLWIGVSVGNFAPQKPYVRTRFAN